MDLRIVIQVSRRLWKDRFHSFISIASTALGLLCAFFLAIYVDYELSYDHNHKDADRIYRVSSTWVTEAGEEGMAITPKGLGPHLAEKYREIESSARLELTMDKTLAKVADKEFAIRKFFTVDQNIDELFTFKIIKGGSNLFSTPGQLAISRSTAMAWFGTVDCLNELVVISDENATVSAVYEDLPQNVDLKINAMLSSNFEIGKPWEMYAFYTYIKTAPNTSIDVLESKLGEIADQFLKLQTVTVELNATSLLDLHFESGYLLDSPKGNLTYVNMAIVGLILVLIITAANISNMLVVNISARLKEIAMRRLMGSSKLQLTSLFYLELMLILTVGAALTLTMSQLLISPFNQLAQINFDFSSNWMFVILVIIMLMTVIGILASYPIIFVLYPKPINALRKMVFVNLPGSQIRSIVFVIQFTLAGLSLVAMNLFNQQLDYMLQADGGVNTEDVYNIQISNDFSNRTEYLDRLKNSANISAITYSGFGGVPGQEGSFHEARFISENSPRIMSNLFEVDSTYFDFFELEFVSRSNELLDSRPENGYAVVNEAFLKFSFGETPESIIGKGVEIPWFKKTTILGVIKDYHYQSMHQSISPLILFVTDYQSGQKEVLPANYLVKTTSRQNLSHFEHPLVEISEVSKSIETLYGSEKRLVDLLGFLSAVSVFIAVLGLIGMITNLMKVKLYEITIKKVLGASVWSICRISLVYFFGFAAMALVLTICIDIYLIDLLQGMYAYIEDSSILNHLMPLGYFFFFGLLLVTGITIGFVKRKSIHLLQNNL